MHAFKLWARCCVKKNKNTHGVWLGGWVVTSWHFVSHLLPFVQMPRHSLASAANVQSTLFTLTWRTSHSAEVWLQNVVGFIGTDLLGRLMGKKVSSCNGRDWLTSDTRGVLQSSCHTALTAAEYWVYGRTPTHTDARVAPPVWLWQMGSLVGCLDIEQWQGLVKDQHKTCFTLGRAGSGWFHTWCKLFFFSAVYQNLEAGCASCIWQEIQRATGKVLSRVGEQHLHFKSPQSLQIRLASDLFFCHRRATTSFSSKQELLHRGWSGEDESLQRIQNVSNPGACTSYGMGVLTTLCVSLWQIIKSILGLTPESFCFYRENTNRSLCVKTRTDSLLRTSNRIF